VLRDDRVVRRAMRPCNRGPCAVITCYHECGFPVRFPPATMAVQAVASGRPGVPRGHGLRGRRRENLRIRQRKK